jgi:CRISPR-associated protein Cmr4
MDGYCFHQVFYRCITPLHIGCGQDVGIVDLPVIRERTTGYPFAPGSGIRGSIRAMFEQNPKKELGNGTTAGGATKRLFGEAAGKPELTAGCLSILDARLLLFPVRSSHGVFQWLTCPFVLQRYARDVEYFLGVAANITIPEPPGDEHFIGPINERTFLEEFPFDRAEEEWSFPDFVPDVDTGKVLLVNDQVFDYFMRNATVITQHNRLTSAKTVAQGQLFSVESLPPETVFYGFFGSVRERTAKDEGRLSKTQAMKYLRKFLTENEDGLTGHLVLGGDESTGLGLTKLLWKGGECHADES